MTSIKRREVLAGMLASGIAATRASTPNTSPSVSITIDDLDVNAGDTPLFSLGARNSKILSTLQQNGLKAALFVCGMRVDNDDGRRHLQQWGHAGHLIANHTYSHDSFHDVPFERFSADVLRAEAV